MSVTTVDNKELAASGTAVEPSEVTNLTAMAKTAATRLRNQFLFRLILQFGHNRYNESNEERIPVAFICNDLVSRRSA